MKVSLWLFALAVCVACFACWFGVHILFQDWQREFKDMPLPAFTQFLLQPHTWLLLVPAPWIVGAVWLTLRKQITPGVAFIFSGTACLGVVTIVSAVIIASLLPYMNLIIVF